MANSIKKFTIGLYEEHLEETSFLFDQRIASADDPELSWLDVGDGEQRIEAHVDGLVVGGDLALELCNRKAQDGDAGELYAAVRVICRLGKTGALEGLWDNVDVKDSERIHAFGLGLSHELGPFGRDRIVALLRSDSEAKRAVATAVVARHQIECSDLLVPVLSSGSASSVLDAVTAIGSIGYRPAGDRVLDLFRTSKDEALLGAAAVALLRLGDRSVLARCVEVASSQPWASGLIGMGAGLESVRALADVAARSHRPDVLVAQGLLGESASVQSLLNVLAESELAEAAALGLNLITGADIFEDAFVPETLDPDELFEDELEKIRNGEPLYGPDDRSQGSNITRLSQDPELWRSWWGTNGSRFRAGIRYRNGQPFTPQCLIDNMRNEHSPRTIRKMAYDELAVRYAITGAFATDMLVDEQNDAIDALDRKVREKSSHFEPGKWYFGGRAV